MSEHLAWIGLGNMGRGMVRNLVSKSSFAKPLVLYNRTQSRATELSSTLSPGTSVVASSIAEAVQSSSIIFICLGDDKAVESIVNTAISSTDVKGKLFVDCSTVHPDTSRKLEKLAEAHGAQFIACPVFGAPPAADAGQVVCVQAGNKKAIERVKPYFAGVIGRANIDLSEISEDPGRAGLLKVIGNSMIFQMVTSVAEGLVVADKTELGVSEVQKFLELVFPGPFVGYSQRMISGDYFSREEPLFGVDWARKDVSHALDLANNVGAEMKATEVVDDYLKKVKEHSGEKGDIAAIYGIARENAGLDFDNK